MRPNHPSTARPCVTTLPQHQSLSKSEAVDEKVMPSLPREKVGFHLEQPKTHCCMSFPSFPRRFVRSYFTLVSDFSTDYFHAYVL